MRKEGQEGEFWAKKEVVEAQMTGMETPCQATARAKQKMQEHTTTDVEQWHSAVRHDHATLVARD